MIYCPITYEAIPNDTQYSSRGLKLLSPQLKRLIPLPLSAKEQRQEAITRAGKMSIQGVQTKLSAQLKIKEARFNIVDSEGHYTLKLQSEYYPELPQNEAITMSLAARINIEVPVHGLLYAKDESMTYFIKRFDRSGHKNKLAVEDFTQLLGLSRETKYQSSMEQIAKVIYQYCSFPKIEAAKLFKLTLFNFLIGNEDMHLKNFSLITRDQKVTLSPAYDLLNSTIALSNAKEELALPLNGKKNNLRKRDFLDYFAIEHLHLNEKIILRTLHELSAALPHWQSLIVRSFLSASMKKSYVTLLEERVKRLELD